MKQTSSQRIQQIIFHNHQKKLVWDKSNVDNEMNQELTQNESTGRMLKPKSDKDGQTDCRTEI